MRRPVRVRISDSASGSLREYVAHTPLRVGYGADCDVRLEGDGGPDTLFEFLPVQGPTKISMPVRYTDISDHIDVSVNGEPYQGTPQELQPGTRVRIRDRAAAAHIDLVVDQPSFWSRHRALLTGLGLLVMAVVLVYGAYLFRSIEDAEQRIDIAESRLEQAESQTSRIGEQLAAAGKRFQQMLPLARESVVYIRTGFSARLLPTGESRRFESSGTAFVVAANGLAVAPLHVLEPWRFDEEFLSLLALGVVELQQDTIRRDVWLSGAQVTDPQDDEKYLVESAYSDNASDRVLKILHREQLDTATKLVPTPLGVAEIQRPVAGPTDLAVIQLMDFSHQHTHLVIAADNELLQPLDKVMVVGFPLGRLDDGRSRAQGVMGVVRRTGPNLLELDSALHPGISGAPVLNGDGRVAGMAVAVFGTVSYGVCIPAHRLSRALEQARAWVLGQETRLASLGCQPGPVDGVLDQQTWLASQKPGCALKSSPATK